jgi:hypothetical protein
MASLKERLLPGNTFPGFVKWPDSALFIQRVSGFPAMVLWHNRWQDTGALQQFNTVIEIVQTNPKFQVWI